MKRFTFLLLLLLSQTALLYAHTVDYFTCCGYFCAGSNVTASAHLSNTNSTTNYNWQFRDNSNAWKCLINGNNTINGIAFSVSGATAKGQLSTAPALTILNAKTALEGVTIRLVMADGTNGLPCASNPSYPVYGTDKSLQLHILTGNDCNKIAAICSGAKLKLGNLIWNDLNANGVKDANEPGVPNATVKLYTDDNNDNNAGGSVIATTTTDASGFYYFSNLKTANYIVGVVIPAGYTKGPASTIDPDNNVDNDNNGVYLIGANQAGGEVRSKAITLTASGEPTADGDDANSNSTLDIALCGNSQIGDFVWNDKNANGIQDADEPGIANVTVKLTFPDGVSTATDVTDAGGKYLFSVLAPGTYKVTFSTPSGFTASAANQGTNDAKDSDPVNGSVNVAVAAGTSNLTIDAGFYVKVIAKLTLGNQVWNDRDGNGLRDPDEPGIGGATISLYTDNNGDSIPDGTAIKTTMTDPSGHYLFTDLPEGKYVVSMPVLPGYQQSPNRSTGGIVGARRVGCCSFTPDSDVDNDNNLVRLDGGIVYTNTITLTAGQEPTNDGDGANSNLTLDLAECGNAGIGDFVWNDLNGNGIQDAGEPGINGVKVTITFEDGTTAETVTAHYEPGSPADGTNANAPQYDGYYDFINLGPGTYKITFATPAGLHSSPPLRGTDRAKDSNPIDGAPVTVTLGVNQSDFTIDAGFTDKQPTPPPATCPNLSLGNLVFNDANNNGLRDLNEQGIGGLTVKLYAASNSTTVSGSAISTIMTAADGTYYFGNLAAGLYIVGVNTTGTTYVMGANGQATPDNNVDNDNNGVTSVSGEVRSNAITLSAGDEPINDGSDNNSNLTLDIALKVGSTTPPPCTNHCECRNDCTHTGCGHANCGHNNCHNDCNHTGCGHTNCGHNSCKNDCNHTGCGHPNCSHNSCKNDCKHTDCGHPNCSHNSCKNDCKHTDCGHSNCGKKGNGNGNRTADTESSVITAITAPELTNTSVSIFPNPANDFIVIKVMAAKGGKGSARITDLSGKLVATKTVTIANGMNMVKFDQLQGLRAGTYYVQLDFNYHTYNKQLIIVK